MSVNQPNIVWSFAGLADALQHQKKEKEAKEVRQQATQALIVSGVQITGSVF